MINYVISRRAEADLRAIWLHIAEDDIDAADRVRNELQKGIEKIAQMPGI